MNYLGAIMEREQTKKEVQKMYSRLIAQQVELLEEVERMRFLLDAAQKRKDDIDKKLERFRFLLEPKFLLTPVSNGSSGPIIQGRIKLPKEYRKRMDEAIRQKYWCFIVGKQAALPPLQSPELKQIAADKASHVVLRRIDFNLLI